MCEGGLAEGEVCEGVLLRSIVSCCLYLCKRDDHVNLEQNDLIAKLEWGEGVSGVGGGG